jgi:hypothetical protein
MFGHRFHGLVLAGAKGDALPVSEHEPLMTVNFPDDIFGHLEHPGGKLTQLYLGNVAGTLTL